jgi:hypothetical protein
MLALNGHERPSHLTNNPVYQQAGASEVVP